MMRDRYHMKMNLKQFSSMKCLLRGVDMGDSLFENAGKLFGDAVKYAGNTAEKVVSAAGEAGGAAAAMAGDAASTVACAAGDAAGTVASATGGAANVVAGIAGGAASTVAIGVSDAVDIVADVAGGAKEAIEGKIEEVKAAGEEPDEYDRAVIEYNLVYTDLSDAGLALQGERERATDLMGHVERLVNSIANHPKTFDSDFGEIVAHVFRFRDAKEFAKVELYAARASATSAGAGVAAGMTVASMAPSAALWIATTFGTASTGTAISTLSGAAASQAALAWLGGGALAAGGGGTAAGSALLAMAGPIGWGIAGATLLTSIVLFTKKRLDILEEKQRELTAIKQNAERVSETVVEVQALLTKTAELRERLSGQFDTCLASYGADYSELTQDKQDGLAAMVNNTLALSRLLNTRIEPGE